MEIIEHGDVQEASDKAMAIEIGMYLQKFYPNHPFIVGFQGGALVIRHIPIASEMARVFGREGFCTMLARHSCDTPSELRHEVMLKAGELLEAFGLPRGPWDGRPPVVPPYMLGEVKH